MLKTWYRVLIVVLFAAYLVGFGALAWLSTQNAPTHRLVKLSPATAEERTADYTCWLALLTAALVAIAVGQLRMFVVQLGYMRAGMNDAKTAADAAKDPAETGKSTLIASQRPWLSVKYCLSEPVIWDTHYVVFTIKFTVKNVGVTPALHIWIVPRVNYNLNNIENLIKFLSTGVRSDVRRELGTLLFPGEERVTNCQLRLRITDIDKEDKIARKINNIPEYISPFNAVVYGVVDYQFAFNKERHQTGFIFEIKPNYGPDNRGNSMILDRRPSTEIPLDHLYVWSSLGAFAD